MGTADPRIDRWLSTDRPWHAELRALRGILLSEDLTESLKWRQPCYSAHGGNIVILSTRKEAATLSFLKGVLIDDPGDLLIVPGPNSRSARYLKFTGVDEIRTSKEIIRDYLRNAIENERLGRKVDMPKDDFDYPDELTEAIDSDAALAEAIDALTPGRKRGWVLHFSSAKQSATRRSRIEKARSQILDGKGMHDR